MAAQFDPYHKWLGIPPEEQPPNHYRLLGISLFESDPDVVEASADRIMHFLQSVATGPHLNDSQRLLNEVAAARVCLLNSKKKSEYDATLQVESSGTWFKVCVAAGIAATITLVAFLIWFWGSKPNEFEIVESQPEIQDATSVVITKPETSTTDKIDQTPTTEVSITQNDDPTTPAESVPEPEVIEKASRDLKQQAIEELKKQARDITPENDTAITQRSVNAKYRDIILIRESERTDRIAQIRRERDVLLQQVGDSQQKLKSSQTAWNLAKREYKALDVQARAVKRSAAAVTAQGQQVQRQLNIETDSNAISELRSQLRNLRNAFSRLGSQLKTLQTTAARVTANARKLETKITEEQVIMDGLLQGASKLEAEWLHLVDAFGMFEQDEHRRLIPIYSEWIELNSDDSFLLVHRGISYARISEYENALLDVREAIRRDSRLAPVATAIQGHIADLQGDDDSAAHLFRKSRQMDESTGLPYIYRGDFFAKRHQYEFAITAYRYGAKMMPESLYANLALARLLATCPNDAIRNGKEAVKFAEISLELSHSTHWQCFDVAAAAYAESGDFAKAVSHAQRSIAIAPDDQLNSLSVRRKLYESEKPYRINGE